MVFCFRKQCGQTRVSKDMHRDYSNDVFGAYSGMEKSKLNACEKGSRVGSRLQGQVV